MTDFDHAYHTQPYQGANPYALPQSSGQSHPSDPPPADGRRRPLVTAAAALVALLVLGAAGYGLWTHFVREDPGVAACKEMRDNADLGGVGAAGAIHDKLAEAEYRKLRGQFAKSDKPKIREHGTALMDLAWQLQQLPDGQEAGAPALLGPFGEHSSGLQTACARAGVYVNLTS